MSEKMPRDEPKRAQEPVDEYVDWLGQDREDPVRGPIVHMAETVFAAAIRKHGTPLFEEFLALQHSFPRETYYSYRLYHYIIGSTPPRAIVSFDVEGEDSVAEKIRMFAEKHHIDTSAV